MVAKSDNLKNTTGTSIGLDQHNGLAFSAPDRDEDLWDQNCAAEKQAGWWFRNYHHVNINGKMATTSTVNSLQMSYTHDKERQIISWSEMKMIRVA